MEKYEAILGEYDHTGLEPRIKKGWFRKRTLPCRMAFDAIGGRDVFFSYNYGNPDYVDDYPQKENGLYYFTEEVARNARISMSQVQQANLTFALESSGGLIALTALHLVVEISNIALAFHADRAMRNFHDAMSMTSAEARALAAHKSLRHNEQSDDGDSTPLKDKDGVSYNRCGAAIYWLRGNCPVFEMSVSAPPWGTDPDLRIVTTRFGVLKPMAPD